VSSQNTTNDVAFPLPAIAYSCTPTPVSTAAQLSLLRSH